MSYRTVVLDGDCALIVPELADCTLEVAFDGECGIVTQVEAGDYYTGATTVTPTQETQTLSTLGKIIPTDITINPIPSNYGLITWDGAVLTVS